MQAEFRLLGPVEAIVHGTPIELGRRRERGLLALLLLKVNQPVSVRWLLEMLIDGASTRDPDRALHVAVSRLRRALSPAGDQLRFVSHPAGYEIQCDPDSIDVHRFAAMVEQAQGRDGPTERARILRDALALWRGPALADLDSDRLDQDIRARLNESRLTALELRVEADMATGRHADVAELAELAAGHPARERFTAAWMLALYRVGRQRDALDVYQRIATQLAEEYGLDPGPRLRELHTAILRNDPSLSPPAASRPSPTRPAQLPMDLPTFTGRADELGNLLASRHGHRTAPVIIAIDGMAGIGKTALAVHAAHRLAPHYPDGQLFLDLHGYTEGAEPVDPGDALDRLLRSLGVPGEQIPAPVDDRAALYRSVLAGRKLLVLLDNVATEAQVRPLLPGTPECLTLITSRRHLIGLDEARPLSLEVLPREDAVSLFARIAGPSRFADESPALVEQVVELCGRLPLAVRIAATRLRHRPAWTVAHLVERLRDEQQRLSELHAGQRSIATAINLSYRDLPAAQRRMLRLLGLHSGPDVDIHAAAALADASPANARTLLDDLLDAHLVQQRRPDRYHLHDLVRAYARHACAEQDPEPEQRAALSALLGHYASTATAARDMVYPNEADQKPRISIPSGHTPTFSDQSEAAAWLDAELTNILSAATRAAHHGHPDYIFHLSLTLQRHLHTRARHIEAESLHTHALQTARRIGDRGAELTALNGLGHTERRRGRYEPAADFYRQALDLAREIRDRHGELDALRGLGHVHARRGRHGPAADCYEEVLRIAPLTADRNAELNGLIGLGDICRMQGRNELATQYFTRAAELACAMGDRVLELAARNNLGHVMYAQGRHDAAVDLFEWAVGVGRELGNRNGEFSALIGLGNVRRAQGDHEVAISHYEEVLTHARDVVDRNYQFEALHCLGHAHYARGHPEQAVTYHDNALAVARDLGHPDDMARAHNGLAHGHNLLGRPDQARQHWQSALDILRDLELDEIEEISIDGILAQLAALKCP